MLDLKAKLAAAGLVTKKDVEKVEAQQAKAKAKKRRKKSPQRSRNQARGSGSGVAKERAKLNPENRGECYAAIRRWVERARLDGDPQPGDEAFHFTTHQGKLSRLLLPADLRQKLSAGHAAITAFMSNHGLAHAVVSRELALEIHALFPLWLRVLTGHDGAGKLETPA